MAIRNSASELPQRIQQLLDDRQRHAAAIAGIDQVIADIKNALSAEVAALTKAIIPPAGEAATAQRTKGKRRRGRGHFALSADDSILAFVKQEKKPTTHEINQHFKAEGRSSTANNALGKLVIEKKLKRVLLGKGIRGSRYSLA